MRNAVHFSFSCSPFRAGRIFCWSAKEVWSLRRGVLRCCRSNALLEEKNGSVGGPTFLRTTARKTRKQSQRGARGEGGDGKLMQGRFQQSRCGRLGKAHTECSKGAVRGADWRAGHTGGCAAPTLVLLKPLFPLSCHFSRNFRQVGKVSGLRAQYAHENDFYSLASSAVL